MTVDVGRIEGALGVPDLVLGIEQVVVRQFRRHVLIGQVEQHAPGQDESHACAVIGRLLDDGRCRRKLIVPDHRTAVTEARTQRQHRQGFELGAHTHDVRSLEILAERIVVPRLRILPRGVVLDADSVVPVALVVDRNHAPLAERVRRAEHQPRRRDERPAVGAVVDQQRRGHVGIVRRGNVSILVGRHVRIGIVVGIGQSGRRALEFPVERIVGRSVDRRAETQVRRRTIDDARLEVDARAVHDHALVEFPAQQLIVQPGISEIGRVLARRIVEILLDIVDVLALVDALDAQRRTDVDFIVDIGAHRQHILADRAFAPQHRVVVDARIVPDPCRFPRPGIVGIGLVDQKPAVSQHRIPILGIVRPNPVARTAVRIKFVFRDSIPVQLTRIGVADRAALVLPHEPIVVVEIGDAVVAEADIEADERARTLVSVDHDTDVGHRKAVARIAPVLRGVALAAREGHHRRDRNVAVAVHAQTRRVDRHRRKVGAQRGESPRHGHGARRAEVELRLREFDHIGRHQQVLVHQKSAPLLSRSPGRRRGGRKRDYQSFHSRLHIKKVNR